MLQARPNSFNPETDGDRPELGSIIEEEGEEYIVREVEHVLASDYVKEYMMQDREPDEKCYDKVFIRSHITRPFVLWFVWANRRDSE